MEKPGMDIKKALPARDSDTPLTKSGEALPSARKRAGVSILSERGRNVSKSCGNLCISSITIRPLSGPIVTSGVERAAFDGALSSDNYH